MLLFKIEVMEELKKRGYTTYRIRENGIFAPATMKALRENRVAMNSQTIDTLCRLLDMQPGEIMEYVPDETEEDFGPEEDEEEREAEEKNTGRSYSGVLEDIRPFLTAPAEVRRIILSAISKYTREDLKAIDIADAVSIRRRTLDVVTRMIDEKGQVFLCDEVNPEMLAETFIKIKNYTTEKGLVLALICRTMVTPINRIYALAEGKTDGYFVPYSAIAIKGDKFLRKKWEKKVMSRKGCKMIRAKAGK